jgi:hypothetical protein
MAKKTFEQWMSEVDAELRRIIGLTHRDLPDVTYYDWYEARVSPKTAAKRVLKNARDY